MKRTVRLGLHLHHRGNKVLANLSTEQYRETFKMWMKCAIRTRDILDDETVLSQGVQLARAKGVCAIPRKKLHRRVHREPPVSVFKPAGIPARDLDEILITVDEFEAIRLADFEGMSQREASVTMQISQPTFNRVLSSARSKIAKGLVQGDVLRIEGGRYLLEDGSGILVCVACGHTLDMKSDDRSSCPKCDSTNIRWDRWEPEKHGPA